MRTDGGDADDEFVRALGLSQDVLANTPHVGALAALEAAPTAGLSERWALEIKSTDEHAKAIWEDCIGGRLSVRVNVSLLDGAIFKIGEQGQGELDDLFRAKAVLLLTRWNIETTPTAARSF